MGQTLCDRSFSQSLPEHLFSAKTEGFDIVERLLKGTLNNVAHSQDVIFHPETFLKIGAIQKGMMMRFETERLIIRKPELQDTSDVFKNYTQDSEVTRYLVWKPHTTFQMTEDWIKICRDSWDITKHMDFIIWHKKTQEAIGMISIEINDFIVNFGYVLAKSFWNKGIMTEACQPVISDLIKRKEIFRIEAVHDVENPASGKVMEKLGMNYEGILKKYSLHPNISEIPRDCKMYAMVK